MINVDIHKNFFPNYVCIIYRINKLKEINYSLNLKDQCAFYEYCNNIFKRSYICQKSTLSVYYKKNKLEKP